MVDYFSIYLLNAAKEVQGISIYKPNRTESSLPGKSKSRKMCLIQVNINLITCINTVCVWSFLGHMIRKVFVHRKSFKCNDSDCQIQYFFLNITFYTNLFLEFPLLSCRTSTSDLLFVEHLFWKKISTQNV